MASSTGLRPMRRGSERCGGFEWGRMGGKGNHDSLDFDDLPGCGVMVVFFACGM
jgi:hypothetical protein